LSSSPPYLFVPSNWEISPGILLLCFSYAGGSPYIFMDWREKLQPEIRVAAVQPPGRGMRMAESPYCAVEQIVSEVTAHFPAIEDHGFALYGHSLGAILALELARSLRRAGGPQPRHLFVGGSRPPQSGPTLPLLHELAEPEFVRAVDERYSGIPAAVMENPEVLALLLPALRADFAAYETYVCRPEPPLDCPISAFAGEGDAHAPEQAMEGWSLHTSTAFDLSALPGDHFFLQESRDQLTARIRRRLTAPL
jgi:medium-chain acyl-[acyl-carrier-protein] hydrolase